MKHGTFTIAVAFLCTMAAAEQPQATIVSSCECRDNHGKDRWAVTALDWRNFGCCALVCLTLAHVNGRRVNPMVNQRSANGAATAVKAMPTVTETAAANG